MWRMVGLWGPKNPFLGVTVALEAEAGTMEATVPSKAVAGDNWVSLSPSNRATSL